MARYLGYFREGDICWFGYRKGAAGAVGMITIYTDQGGVLKCDATLCMGWRITPGVL